MNKKFLWLVFLPLVFLAFACSPWFATVSVKLSANPTSGSAPLTVIFTATGESSDLSKAHPYSYVFYLDYNNSSWGVQTGSISTGIYTVTLVGTYDAAGTYQPKFTMSFNSGQQATASLEITVSATTGAN